MVLGVELFCDECTAFLVGAFVVFALFVGWFVFFWFLGEVVVSHRLCKIWSRIAIRSRITNQIAIKVSMFLQNIGFSQGGFGVFPSF